MKILILILVEVFCIATLLGCETGIAVKGQVFESDNNSGKSYLKIVSEDNQISDSALQPLDGVKVELLMPSEYTGELKNPWRQETTGPDGTFRLVKIVPREHYKFRIRMSREGHEAIEIELDFPRDARATLEGVMIKKQQ